MGRIMMPNIAGDARSAREYNHVRTSCGRELTVGRLVLGNPGHPAARVFVNLGACPDCDDSSWAGLTVAEARQLASALLSQAAARERDCRDGQDLPGRVTVRQVDGDTYAVTARGHASYRPARRRRRPGCGRYAHRAAGSFTGIVRRFLRRALPGPARLGPHRARRHRRVRHGGRPAGPSQRGQAADHRAEGVPPQRTDALLAVASHCTVHNTLRQPS